MLQDADFGKIDFVVSQRAVRIRVRIKADGLTVSLPPRSTEKEAMAFVNSVREQILAKQKKLRVRKEKSGVVINENSVLQTLTFRVDIKRVSREKLFFSLRDKVLLVEMPLEMDCNKEGVQKALWNGISYFLRKEAKRILPSRVDFLAKEQGFSYSAVKIQSSKSHWGSCSSRKSINLSFYLLLLPLHLIDYVILHELCHTKEMNHSPKFWDLMARVSNGKAEEWNKELKKHSMP